MTITDTPHASVGAATNESLHAAMPDGSLVSAPVQDTAILSHAGLDQAALKLPRLLAPSTGPQAEKGVRRPRQAHV